MNNELKHCYGQPSLSFIWKVASIVYDRLHPNMFIQCDSQYVQSEVENFHIECKTVDENPDQSLMAQYRHLRDTLLQ